MVFLVIAAGVTARLASVAPLPVIAGAGDAVGVGFLLGLAVGIALGLFIALVVLPLIDALHPPRSGVR